MNFDEYTKSYLYKYAENPFTAQEFEAISKKDLAIIKYVNDKINKISKHKDFDKVLIFIKNLIEKIELVKIYRRISLEQITICLSYINLT
jgi:hypothetical protein